MNPNVLTGTVTGTGAAITIPLGFVPDYVKIVNITDGDIMHEFFKGMTNGHAMQSTNSASTQFTRITANGITLFDGNSSTGAGFSIGTAVSESTKVLGWIAVRNGAGG